MLTTFEGPTADPSPKTFQGPAASTAHQIPGLQAQLSEKGILVPWFQNNEGLSSAQAAFPQGNSQGEMSTAGTGNNLEPLWERALAARQEPRQNLKGRGENSLRQKPELCRLGNPAELGQNHLLSAQALLPTLLATLGRGSWYNPLLRGSNRQHILTAQRNQVAWGSWEGS